MQKQKRGFWLFIFSLIPGAGEMYMGFKKQGLSIMLMFWGVFAVGSCTGMDWLIFLIPIIWFYSFFNVHNLKSLSEEEFYSIEDSYIFHIDQLAEDFHALIGEHRKLTAIVLIIFGASILWNNIVDFFYIILPDYLADILGSFAYHLPQLVIAVIIILAGIYILTRKKDELENEPLNNNKEEHYWTPYRPYQQSTPATPSNEPDIHPEDITTDGTDETLSDSSSDSLPKTSPAVMTEDDSTSPAES